ncbi:MAG: hypothetical protein WCP46_08725, partial [Alphaproteobacteria bacterium]
DEDDPVEIIRTDYEKGELVCWGLDVDQFSEFTIEVIQDGKISQPMVKIVNMDGASSFEEACEWADIEPSEPIIRYNTSDARKLGDNFDLVNCQHLAFEKTYFSEIILTIFIPVTGNFVIEDVELIVRDMDVDTELSSAFYRLGIGDGVEKDIIGISYQGEEYIFECKSSGGLGAEFTIVSKEDDQWDHDHNVSLVRF